MSGGHEIKYFWSIKKPSKLKAINHSERIKLNDDYSHSIVAGGLPEIS
ncbi:hypothetical protein ND16A_2243 [Thalassotalea sp. ND16A]|nr:hypothetical protein ND16A_2242 [Thalassotalea sp. ND16A]KGJ89350.1 hypothetical protein ND16A_2243 [Thalassotalea sp. ND16A]